MSSVVNDSLQTIYDRSKAAITGVNVEGNIIYINSSGKEFFKDQNIDERLNLICVVSNKQVYKNWNDLKEINNTVKMTFINNNGVLVNVEAQINFLSDHNIFIIHLLSSIDNYVETSAKAHSFENLLKIFNEFNQPIVLSNTEGIIIGYNQVALNLLQLDLVLVNLHYDVILNDYEYHPTELIKFYKDIALKNMGEIILKRDKNGILKQVKLLGFYYEEKDILISTFVSLNNQIETAKKLNSSELALRLLGESTAKILHEINNPLTTLKGYLKLLSRSTSSNSTYFEIIEKELQKIEALTSDLLYISNPRSDLYQRVSFDEIILECITLFEQQLKQAECALEFYYDEDEDYHFFGHADRIKQVLINLIKNAFEAIEENNSKGLIKIKLEKLNGYCVMVISDNGSGIPKHLVEKLFEPFFTTKDDGTGLGLSITKQLIEEHSGFIEVSSNQNQGTTFAISIPTYDNRVNSELLYEMS